MKAYSADLRERVFADCDAGLSTSQVAAKYRVSSAWVRRLLQRRRERGEVAPRQQRHAPPRWLPYADLKELQEKMPVRLSIPTLFRALRTLGLTFKKKSSVRRSRTVRT
jgi:transposase